jgi:5S rRNA maturation endonuclease (ribonuclease M5)
MKMVKEKEIDEEILPLIEKSKNNFVIVEGAKDEKSLKKLGFTNIFVLNKTQKSMPEKVEEIEKLSSGTEVSILTDFDKKGILLHDRLKQELSLRKVKLGKTLRKSIGKLNISHVEGLDSYLENLMED